MKKVLLAIVLVMFFLPLKVNAKTIKVVSLEHFSTKFPSKVYNIQTLKTECIGDGIFIEKGTIISGYVTRVQHPQLFQRDSYFIFRPVLLTYDGKSTNISQSQFIGKVVGVKHIDPEAYAGNLAIKAANFVLLGSSQAISFAMGAADAQDGEKIKGGLGRMYQDSLIKCIEPGQELNINIGDTLILKINKIR